MVSEALKQVFDHDEEARIQQLNPTERLAYHQPPVVRSWRDSKRGWNNKSWSDGGTQ